jgi:hypothetical protein
MIWKKWRESMRPGDLILYGTKPHWKLHGVLGILLRKLQYETVEPARWDGEPAWWVQFVGDEGPLWTYETDMYVVVKGN